jgi:CO/xanthine dehydrogenase FAD-binding subunit
VKLAAFEHHRPSSVAEAVHLLGSLPDAKVLAGGQSLIPVMALRMGTPAHLVDLGRIDELQTIDDDGEWLTIGAGVRQSTLERFPDLATRVPLLSASLPNIGHRAIRNRGTVCGSLAHADPAAELPAAAVVLGAELVIVGPAGRRTVTADSFFLGYLSTAIGGDELLVQVRFPIAAAGQGAAVAEAQPAPRRLRHRRRSGHRRARVLPSVRRSGRAVRGGRRPHPSPRRRGGSRRCRSHRRRCVGPCG